MEKLSNKRIFTPIAIGVILILAILVGGFTLWQYQEIEKEGFDQGEMIIPEKKKVCSPDNQEYCDKSCETDDDCAFSCYLNCYNKHQEVIFPEPPWPTCGLFSCQCLDGKCEVLDESANWKTYREEIDIEKYLHEDCLLKEEMSLTKIEGVSLMMVESGYFSVSAEEVLSFAIQQLQTKSVSEIEICEVHWIAAPYGGFLIDGKGSFNEGTKHYSTFRIGVTDSSKNNAVKEFTFIARGEDNEDNVIWYPESFHYFFFSEKDKEDFEDLSSRFK